MPCFASPTNDLNDVKGQLTKYLSCKHESARYSVAKSLFKLDGVMKDNIEMDLMKYKVDSTD